MQEWHNKHRNRRAFVLGTGPSLMGQVETLDKLQKDITFGCSKLFLWEDMPFTPTYQVMTEHEHIQNLSAYKWDGVTASFAVWQNPVNEDGWVWVPKAQPGVYTLDHGTKGMGEWEPLTQPRTSPLVAVQLALWMGVKTVYLLGCDLTNVGTAYNPEMARNVSKPDVLARVYAKVAEDMEANKRSLINCTPTGYLREHDVIPYRELSEVLK